MRHLAFKHLENQLWHILVPFQQFLNGNIDYSNVIKLVRHFLNISHAPKMPILKMLRSDWCCNYSYSSHEPAMRKSPEPLQQAHPQVN